METEVKTTVHSEPGRSSPGGGSWRPSWRRPPTSFLLCQPIQFTTRWRSVGRPSPRPISSVCVASDLKFAKHLSSLPAEMSHWLPLNAAAAALTKHHLIIWNPLHWAEPFRVRLWWLLCFFIQVSSEFKHGPHHFQRDCAPCRTLFCSFLWLRGQRRGASKLETLWSKSLIWRKSKTLASGATGWVKQKLKSSDGPQWAATATGLPESFF